MPILLASDPDTLATQLPALRSDGIPALLRLEESTLALPLMTKLPDLVVVDVRSPRFSRLNFDLLSPIVLDLDLDTLLSSAGRRLVEVLGRLADETLTLALGGAAVGAAGAFLADGVTAALNLVPGTVILPAVQETPHLHELLAQLSSEDMRLLALDAPVAALYERSSDTVAVFGAGSVLLVAFQPAAGGELPTARLHALSEGMQRSWPGGQRRQ